MTLSDFKQMRLRSKSTEMVGIRGFLCETDGPSEDPSKSWRTREA